MILQSGCQGTWYLTIGRVLSFFMYYFVSFCFFFSFQLLIKGKRKLERKSEE